MALEPGEQDREAGPTADGHHFRSPPQMALPIEEIDDRGMAAWQQRVDDRAVQPQQRDRGEDGAGHQEKAAAHLAPEKLQGENANPGRKPNVQAIQSTQKVSGAETEERDADDEQDKPAFDANANLQPAGHTHHQLTF